MHIRNFKTNYKNIFEQILRSSRHNKRNGKEGSNMSGKILIADDERDLFP